MFSIDNLELILDSAFSPDDLRIAVGTFSDIIELDMNGQKLSSDSDENHWLSSTAGGLRLYLSGIRIRHIEHLMRKYGMKYLIKNPKRSYCVGLTKSKKLIFFDIVESNLNQFLKISCKQSDDEPLIFFDKCGKRLGVRCKQKNILILDLKNLNSRYKAVKRSKTLEQLFKQLKKCYSAAIEYTFRED